MTTYPQHGLGAHRPHVNPWFVAVVVLTGALIGLSAWVVVDRTGSKPTGTAEPTQALAPAGVVAMLDSRLAALNSGGKQSLARYYSPDTTFTDFGPTPPVTAKGAADVASLNEGISRMWAEQGLRIKRTSDVVRSGRFVVHAVLLGPTTRGVAVYELDEHGKIAGQWVFGN